MVPAGERDLAVALDSYQPRIVVLDTPVLLLVYNRPELTRRVFAAVRAARPKRLFVVADGAKEGVADADRVARARAETEAVDWPAEVRRDYAPRNLGCKRRVASGLDWFFGEVERGIVLEDDCLPHASFFPYCERMLDIYESDDRVMHVSGSSFVAERRAAAAAPAYLSVYPTIWGWATWRRAWRHYDAAMPGYPEFRRAGRLAELFPRRFERTFWEETLERMHRGEIDTWDHAWTYAIWRREGLAVVPNVNLVENIGAGVESTHMRGTARPPALDPQGFDVARLATAPDLALDREADTRTLRSFLRFFSRRARLRLLGKIVRGALVEPLARARRGRGDRAGH